MKGSPEPFLTTIKDLPMEFEVRSLGGFTVEEVKNLIRSQILHNSLCQQIWGEGDPEPVIEYLKDSSMDKPHLFKVYFSS